MTTETLKETKQSPSKLEGFIQKQIAMLKYAFAIDRALIHMVFAALMIGFAIFTDKTHYLSGYLPLYHWGLLIGAGVQTFRACQHSLTPVALLLALGFGGQVLLSNHVSVYLPLFYLQIIAGAGVIGLVISGLYRLR